MDRTVTSPHRARRASCARSWARAPTSARRSKDGKGTRIASGVRSAERKRFDKKRGNQHLLDCGGENHPRPTRTSRASALRGRHRRRDPRRRESHGAEWAQREDATRDTRTMTDDEGTRPYFTARCARCKRPPLLAGRLLAHEPAASSVRATPPRRPPARAQRRGQRRRRCGEL